MAETEASATERPTEPPRRWVYVQTFGCQMNVNDTDRMLQVLGPAGYRATDEPARADLIVLNTCSVRDRPEKKVLSELGRLAPLKDLNPELLLAVGGCVGQQEGEKLFAKARHLDLVFGPDAIGHLDDLVAAARERRRVVDTDFIKRRQYEFIEAQLPRDAKASEFVTVMKGCDKVCAFCIVPFTRGREVSKPATVVVAEVERLVAAGAREVTLLGQNVNSYGKDRPGSEPHFHELLARVDQVAGLRRLRFTTSHPVDCTDELIDCFGSLPTLCEYLHLPVQAGSDSVLAAMRRRYDVAHYLGLVAKLRTRCPDIALTTDIIVGFPGETDEDFRRTLELLERVRYTSIYAFKYSPRPGTRAASLPDDVPDEVKKQRLAAVQELQRPIVEQALASYRGRTVEVLFEKPSRRAAPGAPQVMGRTRTNVAVNVPVEPALERAAAGGPIEAQRWIGELAHVKVESVKAHSLLGRIAPQP